MFNYLQYTEGFVALNNNHMLKLVPFKGSYFWKYVHIFHYVLQTEN